VPKAEKACWVNGWTAMVDGNGGASMERGMLMKVLMS
jgi:hypothetical protein